ncbi:MAG: DUF4270 family protein [Muribaculaceae bacterium]|nr:DUF4270 family protein [Muribaculaceae bacterium]
MRNNFLYSVTVAIAAVSLFFTACQDEVSSIGGSITSSEVTINIDSLEFQLDAKTIQAPAFESRSAFTLLGSINVPEYGELNCSYVTQFLPAESFQIPDSITPALIDSAKIILSIPKPYITGDTLAPQQLTVFDLTQQLPSDISADFNPEGYYNASAPLAKRSYTLSGYEYTDSSFIASSTVEVPVALPKQRGQELYAKYLSDPEMFVWPQDFAEYWPGIYTAPSFGKGSIAAVQQTSVYLYYPYSARVTSTNEDGETVVTYEQRADSTCVLTTAPEVISNVNINFTPSKQLDGLIAQGKSIITTPGGYAVSFRFPAEEILSTYWSGEYDLGVINNMVFSLPAKPISNAYGIGVPPALLLVKTSEMDAFFAEGKVPDNQSAFYSSYSSDAGSYTFSSMRDYIVNLKNKGLAAITDDDVDFTLIPVQVTTEDYTDPTTGVASTQVTSAVPFILRPTMVELDTQAASIIFTYSNQTLN